MDGGVHSSTFFFEGGSVNIVTPESPHVDANGRLLSGATAPEPYLEIKYAKTGESKYIDPEDVKTNGMYFKRLCLKTFNLKTVK